MQALSSNNCIKSFAIAHWVKNACALCKTLSGFDTVVKDNTGNESGSILNNDTACGCIYSGLCFDGHLHGLVGGSLYRRCYCCMGRA